MIRANSPKIRILAALVLEVRIQKQFASAETALKESASNGYALDVAFEAPEGFTIVFGASGAGKTTLLNCIAGIARPEAGRIAVGGRVIFDLERGLCLPVSQRRVGYLFQGLALFPHLTAEQNIAYGLAKVDRREQRSRADAILSSFQIDHLRQRKPAHLSGGERQRVALARALVTDPYVLLLDEPLAALDLPTKSRILDDLRAWNETHRVPILYVTHSRDEVFALGERLLVLEQGRIIAQGTPHEVMTAPRLETVAQLSGFENIFDADVEAVHEDRGTMTCRVAGSGVCLETPLVRALAGARLRVGIRAGDVLLATSEPREISARNIISGRVTSVERRDVIILARVACGPNDSVQIAVQLTLAARDSLGLIEGREVWLIIKTHSCHLMAC
jgi:molybdate transport system ATP-binding protein